ncbi:amidohydrolase family protein [Streptomyces avicenniae]|uniref:amidohydrolase family protein n=1 Tax=Streptomyces avicenniae TaxID=500153 RepID=UPI000699F139|nr:amidohydrolase family protein [Streptomyces avicenniae]
MNDSPAPLLDVHAHFLTDAYVAAAKAAGHVRPDGMPGWPSWDARDHLRQMDEAGIATALLSVSSPGTHFGDDAAARALSRAVNDAGAALRRDHPDRYGHLASLPLPDVEGALAEATRALDVLGSDGLTVLSNAGGVYLGDERFEPLWTELDRRRAVVLVHPTSPPCAETLALGRPRPMAEYLFDEARAASDLVLGGVLTRHPGIRWIVTHGGGVLPLLADRLELFRPLLGGAASGGPGVREQLSGLWYDTAGTPFPRQIPALVGAFGSDRVLYGSDSCWTPAAGVAAQVASLGGAEQPPGTTWRALTTRNAARLFPHLPPTGGG